MSEENSTTLEDVARQESQLPSEHPSEQETSRREFEYLFRLFELYTNVQVEADTVYFNRTSIITLGQGLLFVAYQSIPGNNLPTELFANTLIAVLGFVLALLWIFFEQRNFIYFKGRGAVLRNLEAQLDSKLKASDAAFEPFWTEVPRWVKVNANWAQRLSAQTILRVVVPLMFAVAWVGLLVAAVFGASGAPSTPAPIVVVTPTPTP